MEWANSEKKWRTEENPVVARRVQPYNYNDETSWGAQLDKRKILGDQARPRLGSFLAVQEKRPEANRGEVTRKA